MTPENQTQSKLNLLRASLQQLCDSDLFTVTEKQKLVAPIKKEIEKLTNNQKEAPTK